MMLFSFKRHNTFAMHNILLFMISPEKILQYITHSQFKVGVAHKRNWPTATSCTEVAAIVLQLLGSDASYYRAICMMLEVKIDPWQQSFRLSNNDPWSLNPIKYITVIYTYYTMKILGYTVNSHYFHVSILVLGNHAYHQCTKKK